MALHKRSFVLITILLSASLMGLVGIQLHLLNRALELKRQAFRENVNAALAGIVQKLEATETFTRVVEVAVDAKDEGRMPASGTRSEALCDTLQSGDSLKVTMDFIARAPEVWSDSDKVFYRLPSPQRVRILVLDSLGRSAAPVVNDYKPAGVHVVELHDSDLKKGKLFANFTSDSTAFTLRIDGGRPQLSSQPPISTANKQMLVRRILEDLEHVRRVPITDRISAAGLDSVIGVTLKENGIALPYAFGVLAVEQDSLSMAQPKELASKLIAAEFKSRLFPSDFLSEPYDLVLFFPQQGIFLLKQMVLLSSTSLLLLAVVVFGFFFSIRTIAKQKRFATALTDFINNMTHEFKTPITTISLAAEALGTPEAGKDRQRSERYHAVIQQENSRMRQQVEKILHMAALEEGDYELHKSRVDVHELIEQAVKNIAMQIERRNGSIECRLAAHDAMIEADGFHLTNVLHNLLDNANKYSPQAPDIVIETADVLQGIRIRVTDHGLGLSVEDQKRIFDKFYRVPTGNVHDVKGFGLGLSYVKLMVKAHRGKVSVKCELGKGSTFEVILPRSQDR